MADDIAQWLGGLGLGQYAQAFAENDIDFRAVAELSEDDLKELGLSLGHRRILQGAIRKRTEEIEPAGMTTSASASHPSPTPAIAERRQLTVLFCDLVGSTELSSRLDPEDMREVLRAYQNAVAGEITRFEGHVAKFMGDGVLCYFGWPRAHEDDAERAVRAALSVLRAITRLTTPQGDALAARAGVSTGLVVVGDLVGEGAAQEEVVVGETPNLAARLQDRAKAGELVISETTRNLLGELFDLEALGAQDLKGIAGPVDAFVVRGEREMESRFEAHRGGRIAAMVGRDQELALLLERWRQARAGEGQVVLLTGEAGIGKSRFARALIDAVAADDHIRVRYQCSPYHIDSALFPAIQQLRLAAGFDDDDAPGQRLDKLEALLGRAVDEVDAAAPLVATLLGLDTEDRYGPLGLNPQQQRTRTLQALVDQLIGLARVNPVLFVIEDAHWIDPTTLELIDLAIDRVAGARILLLVTARPTFEHNFGGHPCVTLLTLNRLGREQMAAIVGRLTGDKTLPRDLLDEIAAKTDGVPLFVEELTKTILESGLLRETEDAFVLDRPLDSVVIPASLHDSLMARLDRLEPVREVAQMAACIGREFDYALIAEISSLSDEKLVEALERLVAAELVFRRGVPPEASYLFKHALVRDAAYESLLKGRRQAQHARILEALERDGAAAPELLAHHATEAGLTETAIEYWRLAGASALARPAYREAIGHLTNALHLLRRLGDDRHWREAELELQVSLGQALIASQGYAAPTTTQAFSRALKLAESLGDTALLFPALYGVWASRYVRGEPALDLAERFLDAAARAPDTGPRLVALRTLALEHYHQGRFAETLDLVEEILDGYDPVAHRELALLYGHDARAAALSYRAWALTQFGYLDQAQQASEAALSWAEERDHGNTTGYALCFGGLVPKVMQRRVAEVDRLARRTIDLADELVLPLWRGWAKIFLGWSRASNGGDRAELDLIADGLAETRATGAERLMPFFLGLAAEAHARLDDRATAMRRMEEAFASLDQTRDVAWEAGLYCIRGRIASSGRNDDGEEDLRHAIDIARARNAKSVELRATTGLSRLLDARGMKVEARDLLASIYGWFSEGYDVADLKEAKALLDELS